MEKMTIKKQKRISIGLLIALILVTAILITMTVLYGIAQSERNNLKISVENNYQKNFTELVDNVNNSEIKLSKVVASDYSGYAKTLLNEVSKNATNASANLSALPVTNEIEETIAFINQSGGYFDSIGTKIDKGHEIQAAEKETINKIHDSYVSLKNNLNDISSKQEKIYDSSIKINEGINEFTISMKNMKDNDIEYPTMIYDGPFSASMVNKQIKNLNKPEVSKDVARQRVLAIFSEISDTSLKYLGETQGRFETYDFSAITTNNINLNIQITKKGGELLTVSGYNDKDAKSITSEQAIQKALNFTSAAGIKNLKSVWNDTVGGNEYINLAPLANNIILYPDLIKVKVDLNTGDVVGYEASSYFTNHTARQIKTHSTSAANAETKVPKTYDMAETKLCIAPLDYNREVLCYEVKAYNGGDTYYFYTNAETGVLENILRVIETENGNLLM